MAESLTLAQKVQQTMVDGELKEGKEYSTREVADSLGEGVNYTFLAGALRKMECVVLEIDAVNDIDSEWRIEKSPTTLSDNRCLNDCHYGLSDKVPTKRCMIRASLKK